jgi:16S rRNA (guanine527-N7)-methyltransferase
MNVREALEVSRTFGFLGPGPVEDHLMHAEGFAVAIEQGLVALGSVGLQRCMDLGTGGGVPGLVLIERFPESEWVFLDSIEKRLAVVADLVADLGFSSRCEIRLGRAEELGRAPQLRASFDLVVARGFSGPAVTVECAAPFLHIGGFLVVSDPPVENDRWPADGLRELGMTELFRTHDPYRFFGAVQESACPERYPRRVGIPGKRPLF